MFKFIVAQILISLAFTPSLKAAGLDELSKSAPSAPPATPLGPGQGGTSAVQPASPSNGPNPSKPKPHIPAVKQPEGTENDGEPEEEESDEKPEKDTAGAKKGAEKPIERSDTSKALEDRLSLGTSIGWTVIKPAKGAWMGLGASDVLIRWKNSSKSDEKLAFTGRYVPFTGIWTVDNRDYDTTLHGLYFGAEYLHPTPGSGPNLKAGVELGYMMIYAKAQDGAEEASDVKGGTANLGVSGGVDWSLLSGKVKVGPFLRVQTLGFSVIHMGASADFIF